MKLAIKVFFYYFYNELYAYLQQGKNFFSKSVRTLVVNQ